MSHSRLSSLTNSEADTFDISQWEEYGAVYEYNDLLIQTEMDEYEGTILSSHTVNSKLRILSRNGIKYGTLRLERMGEKITRFEIRVVDAKGSKRNINLKKIENHYEETGDIVVPQVEVGSTIYLTITFTGREPISSFENILNKKIPVAVGRFTFLFSSEFGYSLKSYNTDSSLQPVHHNALNGLSITEKNILPLPVSQNKEEKLFLLTLMRSSPSRVAVVIKSIDIPRYSYRAPSWQEMAATLRQRLMAPSFFVSQTKLQKLAEELSQSQNEEFSKADTILQYVQENLVTLQEGKVRLNKIDVERVLEVKKGNAFEVAVVFNELLKAIGIQTKIYITRLPYTGDFDPDFATWAQLHIPIIAVQIADKEYLSFPFLPHFQLGEYPSFVYNQYGLNLEKGEAIRMPAPLYDNGTLKSSVEISLASGAAPQWEFTFGDDFSVFARYLFKDVAKKHSKEVAAYLLELYEEPHKVDSASVRLGSRGGDVTLDIHAKNRSMKINHPDGEYYPLSSLFRSYSKLYDLLKHARLKNEQKIILDEKVILRGKNRDELTVNFSCENIDNEIFSTACKSTHKGKVLSLERKLTIKKANIGELEHVTALKAMAHLDTISRSFVVVKP